MRRKPILTGVIIAGMLLAAAPMAQADESDLAVDVLDTLTVTDTQADVPGYDNNQSSGSFRFPEDVDDDAYGSKADMWDVIYMRDFDPATIKSDDGDVSYGVLRNDPYSGRDVTYEKGGASDIDIEHVVARSEAWDSGASEWTQAQRDAFANDPLEILAVSSGGNRAHGEKDAAGWLPSVGVKSTGVNNPAYDCLYVARQIAVKDKYDLSVDKDEKNAMSDVLATCPAQTIPDEQDGAYWENADTGDSETLPGDVNGDGKYTPSDLNGIQIVSDDGPLDLDTEWTTHRLDSLPANIRIEGLPDGWTSVPEDRSDPDRGYEILLLPVNDPTGDVVARYALLNAKAFDTADVNGNGRIDFDDLTGIRFIVDGEPYQQFDPDTLHYALPNGMEHTIRVENVPDVWEAIETPKSDGQGGESVSWAFIAPSRAEWVTYTFTWNTNTDTGDDTDTNVDDDTHTNAPSTPSDGGDTTKTPTDQLASTGATITGIGAFTLAILCCGAALGVLLRHRTRN